ncbi:hypothetical protein HDU79_003245 [Rhizoclosmatium sp. JEL0117]|nr:hypothetical protein HDU79_003245 [Rhizoclosmatium sp. JEL0117]
MAADLDKTHIQLSQRTTGLTSLPSELVGNILIYLPITPNLVDIGRASKAMASYIFNDFQFAHRHFHHQCNLKTPYPDLYIFHAKFFGSIWKSLPFNYQTVVFVHALASEHLKRDIVSPLYGFFNAKNWVYPRPKALTAIQLLLDHGFNSTAQTTRILIWATTNNWVEVVRFLLENSFSLQTTALENAFDVAVSEGHLELLQLLLSTGDASVYPTGHDIMFAAHNGYSEVLKLLLKAPMIDSKTNLNQALQRACARNRVKTVKILLEDGRADPTASNNRCLFGSCAEGQLEILDLLLKDGRVDPTVEKTKALGIAASKNNLSIVNRLLQDVRVDPGDNDNFAVKESVRAGHFDVASCLWNNSRCIIDAATKMELIEIARAKGYKKLTDLLESPQES